MAPGQITLTLDFRRRALRGSRRCRSARLAPALMIAPAAAARFLVGQTTERSATSRSTWTRSPNRSAPEDVQLATERLKAPAFVSEALVRRREVGYACAGPSAPRRGGPAVEPRVAGFPRCLVAIGMTPSPATLNATRREVAPIPSSASAAIRPCTGSSQRRPWPSARRAGGARLCKGGLRCFTKLARQPEFPIAPRAQELLGLARGAPASWRMPGGIRGVFCALSAGRGGGARGLSPAHPAAVAEAKARTGRDANGETQAGKSRRRCADGTPTTAHASATAHRRQHQPVPAAPTITETPSSTGNVDCWRAGRGETNDWVGRSAAGYDKSLRGSATPARKARLDRGARSLAGAPGPLGPSGNKRERDPRHLAFLSWQFKASWGLNAAAGFRSSS